MLGTPEDKVKVETAFAAVETITHAPIFCVVSSASDAYLGLGTALTAIIALLAPWPLLFFTLMPAEEIFLFQAALAFVLAITLLLAPTRMRARLTPPRLCREAVHRAALAQFVVRGVSHTPDRCGVLLYVSRAEQHVRLVADVGSAAKIPQGEWQRIVDDVTDGFRRGHEADALVAAANACAKILGPHFPPDGVAIHPRTHFHST